MYKHMIAAVCLIGSDDELLAVYRAGDYRGVLRAGARLRKTIGAGGLPGSGKTQTLRSIMQEIPDRHPVPEMQRLNGE